jgi:OmpR family response regulator RpaB
MVSRLLLAVLCTTVSLSQAFLLPPTFIRTTCKHNDGRSRHAATRRLSVSAVADSFGPYDVKSGASTDGGKMVSNGAGKMQNNVAAPMAYQDTRSARKEKILVVDDEASIRRILETRLTMIGYDVVTAADGEEAIIIFRKELPNLIILDIMMPKLDGYGVCQEIRKESDVPIIMLTALGDVADRITGLELGADDYVIKPFSPKELEARIRSVLRRVGKIQHTPRISSSGILRIGQLEIDTNKRQVFKGNERIRLTGMEFSVLELLISRSGEAFSRAEILQEVWGYTPERHIDTRVVDVHISRLRAKLENDPSDPDLILTARGTGYLFQKITEISKRD